MQIDFIFTYTDHWATFPMKIFCLYSFSAEMSQAIKLFTIIVKLIRSKSWDGKNGGFQENLRVKNMVPGKPTTF